MDKGEEGCTLSHFSGENNHFYVMGPKATKLHEITQNNGHYAVQGHSRSQILVPIESQHTTYY